MIRPCDTGTRCGTDEQGGKAGVEEVPYSSLSVIIATKNRAEELRTISLPSLAKQETRDFETIVWDASENDISQRVVEAFSTSHPEVALRYYKAPRSGLTAQRNDAVKEARGKIIFFIDDDSEVSPDGISALSDMFAKQDTLVGGCLPLDYWWPGKEGQSTRRTGSFGAWLLAAHSKIFYSSSRLSGVGPAAMPNRPGLTDFLSGCDMAFRKEIFRDHVFNERLQKYAGYALWEDQQFSRQLHLEGHCLSIAEKGRVTHRAAPGTRVEEPFNRGRVEAYNAAVIWKTTILPFARWSAVHFMWARIGFLGVVLLPCLSRPWQKTRWKRLIGYLTGLWVFLLEELRGIAPQL
jgi:glycosyltransferase involved in cell wall biosynthesis